MDSALPPLIQATSAAVGSLVGNAIVFPIDVATTRMQHARSKQKKLSLLATLHRLTRRRGLAHMYAGLQASSTSTVLSSFIYFYLYSALHKLATRRRTIHSSVTSSPAGIGAVTSGSVTIQRTAINLGALEELVIGFIAGVASKGVLLPVSAVCVRQQLAADEEDGQSLSLSESLRAIYREEGILGLWSALPPSIPLAILPSFTLYIHSVLLRMFIPVRHRAHPPGSVTFILGAASNVLATLPLYPMILAKVLSQSGTSKQEGSGLLPIFRSMTSRNGFSGAYRGLEGQLVKGILQQGVMMLLKQRVEEGIVKAYRTFA